MSNPHIKGIGVVVALTGGPGDKCLSNGAYCPVCDCQFNPTTPTPTKEN